MIYGLTGASGVGKTTTGDLVADALDITFVKTSVSEAAKAHGFNAVGTLSLPDRLELQELLLTDHAKLLDATVGPAILDRTPVDLAAYMLAEVYMTSAGVLTKEQIQQISSYVIRCMHLAKSRYDFLFHLAPLAFYEQAQTRPTENGAYQKHVDLLIRGMLEEMSGQVSFAILNTTDLNERQDFIHDAIVQRLDEIQALRSSTPGMH